MLSLPLQNYNDATDPGELRPGLEAEQVSPGLLGFLITFVMVAVVVLAGPHKGSFSPGWFFTCLAVILLAVTIVEVGSLATGRTLTVEPSRDPER